MANHHGSTLGGHWKEARTFEATAIKYFWPSMAQDIEGHIKLCKVCHQQDNRDNSKNKVPLEPWGPPTARNQRIHFDLVGPLKSSTSKYKHILSITDAFSRWTELVPIEYKEAITVAKALWYNYDIDKSILYLQYKTIIKKEKRPKTQHNPSLLPSRQQHSI